MSIKGEKLLYKGN